MSNQVDDIANEFKARLELSAKRFDQAAYDARRKEALAKDAAAKLASLRAGWNAPLRQVQNRTALKHSGAWEQTSTKVLDLIGTGFLVALIGTRGGGKTQIAVEAMFEATERGLSARYLTATEFFMAIKSTFVKDAKENESECVKRFAKFKLLVIDEIAKRGETEWENRLLFELIDRRYRDMRDTLVISNQNREEFIASIGPSLADRMNEVGGILKCEWESFRQ